MPEVLFDHPSETFKGCQAIFETVKSAPSLHPLEDVQLHRFGPEKPLGEVGDLIRLIGLAAEDIDVSGIREVCKMSRNQRGLNQLNHRKTFNPDVLAEMDDLTFTESFHSDQLTKLDHVPFYRFRAANRLGIAII
jgi:hypothetical protein